MAKEIRAVVDLSLAQYTRSPACAGGARHARASREAKMPGRAKRVA